LSAPVGVGQVTLQGRGRWLMDSVRIMRTMRMMRIWCGCVCGCGWVVVSVSVSVVSVGVGVCFVGRSACVMMGQCASFFLIHW
jgi:hypothetical protein